MDPAFFDTERDFAGWLESNHASAPELLLGFYKTSSGRGGISYAGALDAALCFGWIDGVRRRLGPESYSIRFTPRKKGSTWSQVNLKRAAALETAGRMQPPGLAAFHGRDERRAKLYSHENEFQPLDRAAEERFRETPEACAFFQAQPASYRRAAQWWAMSAKQEATRARRLAALIEHSANARRLPHLVSRKPPTEPGR
jgi:uncharacterized protein YdeI (YjbR/CyaY-like superfamily)